MNFTEDQQEKALSYYDGSIAQTNDEIELIFKEETINKIVADTIIATCERIQITLNPRGSFNTPVNTINVTNMMIDTLMSQAKDEQISAKPVHNSENEQKEKK